MKRQILYSTICHTVEREYCQRTQENTFTKVTQKLTSIDKYTQNKKDLAGARTFLANLELNQTFDVVTTT